MSAAQKVPLFSMLRPSTSFSTLFALSSAFSSPTLISASGLPMARRTFLHMSVSTCTCRNPRFQTCCCWTILGCLPQTRFCLINQ